MQNSLKKLIAGTRELPSLPATTRSLLDLLSDATVGAAAVLAVIEQDPALTANLLKLSNSAYFGFRRQVGTVRQALVLLGNQTTLSLAFATSMGNVLRGPLSGYHLPRNALWHHALGTALGAAHLASVHGDAEIREQAFTAGLVHDIGKLVLDGALKRQLVQLPPEATSGELLAAERDILGFDHAAAGAALGETWNFPSPLVAVIAAHHEIESGRGAGDTTDAQRAVSAAVAMANLVAGACGMGGGHRPVTAAVMDGTAAHLGFGEAVVADLQERLPADLDSMLGTIGESR